MIDFHDLAHEFSLNNTFYDGVEWPRPETGTVVDEEFRRAHPGPFSRSVFKAWFLEWAEKRLRAKEKEIKALFSGGFISIWRVIEAERTWVPGKRNLGVYWSFDKHSARSYYGKFAPDHVHWRIGSRARSNQIDWENTLLRNADLVTEEENEITLKSGASIPILSLEYSIQDDVQRKAWTKTSVLKFEQRSFAANPDLEAEAEKILKRLK